MPQIEEIQDAQDPYAFKTDKDEKDWEDEESDVGDSEEDSSDDEDEVLERGLVVPQETVWERIAALKDIIAPSTRQRIYSNISTASGYGRLGLLIGGKIAWVVTTTALLVALPCALAIEDEMRITQQERDMMSQHQGAQAMLGPQGQQSGGQNTQDGSQGLRPPGF